MRRLIASVVALSALNLLGDAILWQVDDDFFTKEPYTAARVVVSPSGSGEDNEVLSVVYFDPRTWEYSYEFEDGVGIINVNYKPGTTGEMWSIFDGTTLNKNTATFAIELGNYEFGTGGAVNWTKTVAVTETPVSYNWLVSNGSLGTGGNFSNVHTPWTGQPYVAPEPTSGMLVMAGLMMLALRRKKAV